MSKETDLRDEFLANVAEYHAEVRDKLRDPQGRQEFIVDTYDSLCELYPDADQLILQSLANDCGQYGLDAADVALALSGTHRWRMTDDEVEVLDAMIEASQRLPT
jgi:hypothetical protein